MQEDRNNNNFDRDQAMAENKNRACKEIQLRNMDLIMYVLYSGDEIFVMNMVRKVCMEVSEKYKNEDLAKMLRHNDKPMLYRCLFFLILNFYKDFRYEK